MSAAGRMQQTERVLRAALLTLAVAASPVRAQNAPTDYRDEFLTHFGRSAMKMRQLSAAMPDSLYPWSPGEGVMSVARVYMHIARYNYLYLDGSLGIRAPEGVDWENFESVTDKATIVAALDASIRHVQTAARGLTEEDLTRMVPLYGRQVPGWKVLFQLLSHMNEHVGQSIAYARTNGVVPPWSQ
jgi:uncharacterized damage-inducible protein DinB